jgi:hypothetical protein
VGSITYNRRKEGPHRRWRLDGTCGASRQVAKCDVHFQFESSGFLCGFAVCCGCVSFSGIHSPQRAPLATTKMPMMNKKKKVQVDIAHSHQGSLHHNNARPYTSFTSGPLETARTRCSHSFYCLLLFTNCFCKLRAESDG